MNRELLLAHFDRISDAPDAIPRLRRFILDLAVRGKLVEQDPKDEPAPDLLKRIQAEKARLAREGTAKKEKAVPPLLGEDTPFQIPAHWVWSQLAEIGFINPRNSVDDDVLASFVPMTLISAEYGASSQCEVRPWAEIKSGFTHFADGDVALAKITPCFQNGKSTVFRGLTNGIGAGSTELHVVRPLFADPNYLLVFLKCPHFIETGVPRMTGTAGQKRVPTEYFAYSPFPLPPLAEQHRIVAKVDELMALCDRLESAQAEREGRRDRLAAASLHRLNQPAAADDTQAFRGHASFHLQHLTRLTTRPEQIKQLRLTILNLAVQGRLVQQNPKDEPPESLLSEIRKIREKVPSHSKNSDVDDSDPKFVQHLPKTIPHNWVVCPLEELFRFIDYRGRTPTRTTKGVRLITAKNVRMGYIGNEPVEFIEEQVYGKWMTRGFPEKGDLLFVTEGATMGYVGTIDFQFVFALAQRTIDLQPYLQSYSRFFLFILMSPIFQEAVLTNATGTAVKGLKAAKLKRIRVPVPPLAEQHRIIAKVDELMALCDQLEAQLTTTQIESRRLLEAILNEALNDNQTLDDKLKASNG
jgi:type I restriction enzyme S subunit